ncbi:Transcription termination factor like [Actinidia chinensis var. chinensis]|uniref:Transcription termination factor like n=1 Tax=Actinidia chinensis var. chinensis TaxID=1590841 RepID=A0A2R6P5Z2_ACTCC|nr:Transcription termination factor like [Actinidia chinensis var. chinensis]
MGLSEKKIASGMDFLVNRMGFKPAEIGRYPIVLSYSLDRRIIPRCCVIRVLLLKGFMKNKISLGSFVSFTEKRFLDEFVKKYEEQVPELLSIYQGKRGILEPGIRVP